MRTEEAREVLSTILAAGFGILISAAIGAFIIQFASRRIAGFRPAYWKAFGVIIAAYVSSMIVGAIVGMMVVNQGGDIGGSVTVLMLILSFFVFVCTYVLFFKREDGTRLTFGQASLICLIQVIISALIYGIFMLLLALLFVGLTNR